MGFYSAILLSDRVPVIYYGRAMPAKFGEQFFRQAKYPLTRLDYKILSNLRHNRGYIYDPITADWVDFIIMREREGVAKARIGPVARTIAVQVAGSVVK